MKSRPSLAAVLAIVGLLASACGGAREVAPKSEVELAELRRPGAPPSYWLGERFERLPLTAITATADRPNFVYGTCEIAPGSDGGCAPPLQLQHWPLAERFPGRFELAPGRKAACRRLEAADVEAAVYETTGGVEVYVGDRVVVLFGDPALIRKALGALRPVKEQEPALPPPAPGVRSELRPCAPPSPDTKLRELRAAGGAPVYWVGDSFEGHPLAWAEGDAAEARFVYGECAREALAFDAACWAPLEIQVRPVAPPVYHEAVKCRLGEARGAPTALLASAHTLDVFTRERTVRFIGPDLELLDRAARALRRIDESEPSGQLPAPQRDVVKRLREGCS